MAITIPTQQISKFTVTASGDNQAIGSKTVNLQTKDTFVTDDISVTVSGKINVPAGSFNNQATSGVTYSDNTATNTVIPSGGYLFINKGWFDNTKISLGHLIPEIASNDAGSDKILYGYKAYDEQGNVLTGTIATIDPKFKGGEVDVSGTVTDYTAPSVSYTATGKFLPSGTGNVGATYGVTTTAISGTEGTDFLTIDATHTKSDGSVKAQGSATREPVRYDGNTTGFVTKADDTEALNGISTPITAKSAATTITPAVYDNFGKLYIPIVKSIATTGGGVSKSSGSGSVTGTNPTVTIGYEGKFTDTGTGGTAANYGIIEGVPSSGTDGTNFLKIKIGGNSNSQTWSGTATINYSRAAVTLSSALTGAIAQASGTSVNAATSGSLTHSISGTVAATVANDKVYSIPITSVSFSGGAISATAGGSVTTAPVVTYSASSAGKNSGGTAITIGDYGVEATTAASTNGYITFTASGSATTNGAVLATADAHKNAVTYTNSAGAIVAHSGSQAQAAADATQNTKSITVTPTATAGTTTKYRIPIVVPGGTGGAVTCGATATVSGMTPAEVTLSYAGHFVDEAGSYGIVNTQPSGFNDGENYIMLDISGDTTTEGSVSGTISGTWSRGNVTADKAYKGAVNLSTSSILLAATNGTFSGTTFSGEGGVVADVLNKKKFYIPIVSIGNISGGGLSAGAATVSGTGNISVTPTFELKTRTGSTDGGAITDSSYGVQTTAPTSGNWIVIDPGATADASKTVSTSVPVTRAAASVSINKGITAGGSANLASGSINATASGTVGTSIQAGTNKYIKVVTPTATVNSHTTSNAVVDAQSSAKYQIAGATQTLPSGVKVLASEPSDFNSYSAGYLVIGTEFDVITAGSSSAVAKASISAGITTGGSPTSSTDTKSVNVTATTGKVTYIKVYNGSYSVS